MNKSFTTLAARILSTLFVPPSFTIIIFTYFAFHLESDLSKRIATILTALIFGFALHIIVFIRLRRKGKIADIDASIKEERTVPFLISVVFYIIGLAVLIYFRVNIVSIAFWFCYISNTLIVVLINKRWKISAHSAGAGGPLAAITFVNGISGVWFLILAVLIGWSRLKLRRHTLAQVLAGGILGFVSTFIQIYLIYYRFGYAR